MDEQKSALFIDRFVDLTPSGHQVETSQQLGDLLEKKDLTYRAVFITADQPGISPIRELRRIREKLPFSSVFFVYDEVKPLADVMIRRMGVQSQIQRAVVPVIVTQFDNAHAQIEVPLQKALELRSDRVKRGKSTAEPVPLPGFKPVRIESLLNDAPLVFDVHVIIPGPQRIKVFAANDPPDLDRILKYISEGIYWVYVRESSLNSCLSYCGFIATTLMSNKDVSLEVKYLHLANETGKLLEKLSPTTLLDTEKLLGNIQDLLVSKNHDPEDVIRLFFKHLKLVEHALNVTLVTGLMSKNLGLSSVKTREQLGFASLLHDVGLMKLPEHLQTQEQSGFAPDEQKVYEAHCEASVEILSSLGITDTAVLQAVAQHHERFDNSGYPKSADSSEVHLFAELIGIGDDLTVFMKRNSETDRKAALQKFSNQMTNHFSLAVIDSFNRTFL